MFAVVQVALRNAIEAARASLKYTNEQYELLRRIVSLLSEKRYVRAALGEDLATIPGACVVSADRISLPADAGASASILTVKYSYAYDLLVRDVVVQGEKASCKLRKTVDNVATVFTMGQLPLQTDNFVLEIVLEPGGYYQKAVVCQELIV